MNYEVGNLIGWLIIISYTATMLNYLIKRVNKKCGKRIASYKYGKSTMTFLIKLFVRRHNLWGYITVFLLVIHNLIQYYNFGFNVTGTIAEILMVVQMLLGMFGSYHYKKHTGWWLYLHRTIAILLIIGILVHVITPQLLEYNKPSKSDNNLNVSQDQTKVFTIDELAQYDGQNGHDAYVAYNGTVYDVTNSRVWHNGRHNGAVAGTDLTEEIKKSPHGDKVFDSLPVVGTLAND